jgi:CubicO group peptidase (beta-lactamase class C family)
MVRGNVPGLSIAVIDKGRVEKTEAYGTLETGTGRLTQPHHLFHACSISKTITAMTALSLVQEGVLDLDADVNQHLCTWKLPGQAVSLGHLLSHQAGITDGDGSFDCLRPGETHPTLLELLRGETRINPEAVHATFAPGSRFAYSDAGYCVVEHLLTEVTGQSFADLVRCRVLDSLCLDSPIVATMPDASRDADVACGHERHGVIVPGRRAIYPFLGPAGVWTSARDLAQIAVEVMGALRGRGRVLTQRMAETMTTPSWNPAVGLGIFLDKPAPNQLWYYHYGWGIGFQGVLSFAPELQSGVVILMNAEPGVPQWQSLIGEVARLIAEEMGWPRTPVPALS